MTAASVFQPIDLGNGQRMTVERHATKPGFSEVSIWYAGVLQCRFELEILALTRLEIQHSHFAENDWAAA
jgi:hypothetical protein